MFAVTGCGNTKAAVANAMANEMDVALSVDGEPFNGESEQFTWVELDQLKTYPDFRRDFDDTFNIMKFGDGSKNGTLYIDYDGNWTGNNTLMTAFANKAFVKKYFSDSSFMQKLAVLADKEVGVSSYEAALNLYYNFIPEHKNKKHSCMDDYLSRKQAMAMICKADTPVIKVNTDEFDNIFGYDEYNMCASQALNCSWLQIDNGSLNPYTYNSCITYAEAIYMIVTRYFWDEYENTQEGSVPGASNAGDIISKSGLDYGYSWQTYELESCLQNPDQGMPEDLYRAMVVGYNHGIVRSASGWQDPIYTTEMIDFLTRAYSSMYDDATYAVNLDFGVQAGKKKASDTQENNTKDVDIIDTGKAEIIEFTTEPPTEAEQALTIDDIFIIYKDFITMTEEEKEALKEATKDYTWELVDKTMVVSNCNYLNVRYGPSTDYSILTSIPVGTEVHVIARCVETGWYRILTDGRIYDEGVVAHQSDAYLTDKE